MSLVVLARSIVGGAVAKALPADFGKQLPTSLSPDWLRLRRLRMPPAVAARGTFARRRLLDGHARL
jgi:hypothetical protein